jgi:hypothetical protein
MWEKILSLIETALTVHKELDRTRDEIKDVRKDLLNLTLTVQRLADEIKLNGQNQNSEIEKVKLELQNYLLRYENEWIANSKPLLKKGKSSRKRPVDGK